MNTFNSASGNQVSKAINRRMENIAKQVFAETPNDRTKFGVVKKKEKGLYTVLIDKSLYTNIPALKSAGNINAGETVVCQIPNNQYSNVYILGSLGEAKSNPEEIGDGTITIKQGGITKGSFTTNQSEDATINLEAGGGDLSNYIPKSGTNEISGNLEWASGQIDKWLLPYLIALKNADPSATPTYPYTGFYQWGNEWQVNARDANNVWKRNLFTLNSDTDKATFSGDIQATGLTDGVTTKTMTQVLAGSTSEYVEIVSNNTNWTQMVGSAITIANLSTYKELCIAYRYNGSSGTIISKMLPIVMLKQANDKIATGEISDCYSEFSIAYNSSTDTLTLAWINGNKAWGIYIWGNI